MPFKLRAEIISLYGWIKLILGGKTSLLALYFKAGGLEESWFRARRRGCLFAYAWGWVAIPFCCGILYLNLLNFVTKLSYLKSSLAIKTLGVSLLVLSDLRAVLAFSELACDLLEPLGCVLRPSGSL